MKFLFFRKDIFITSKLSPANQGKTKCRKSVEETLQKLQTDYIDLFLIHWPGTSKLNSSDVKNKDYRRESWQSLELLYSKKILLNDH